ncbi:4-amino-4-deoxy-L-arabinose transferase [Cupriavidus sp. OV038]|jgi:4-amino-4-deoxy-L-arabinose transferase-like glycosyltransferase|uniref:ArnT family glycosyltransferase n=1 Tax=unclassified Cupriavidus TaxID=2640874 RepID=UPI0008F01A0E|nr:MULTISPECIES: UDP phosphate-alpha-4-amino-4-deoxy-L-arabinose arabinosyl transferase [unclassified Cupriavidus]SFB71097.1 4-amino-4-deoxy-L-arabinose transferase [Cupriavidus sp. OV038]SFO60170.1 4-amino-4-deoxy-L-arabinose transferase [Cupriavidus sp. OV096]
MSQAKTSPVHLTAAATGALPRALLLAICIIYGLAGLFGRDPWKNEDAAGFGVMWQLATGGTQDWLMPNIAGRPFSEDGPLVFWLGGIMIRLFGGWLGAPDASRLATALFYFGTCAFIWYSTYLLGRRDEVQPFAFAFGGQPDARSYGRALADGALLLFLACVGLAMRGHETTAQVGQVCFIAFMLYGLVRSLDKPVQGSLWYGVGLGALCLSSGPILATALLLATALAAVACRPLPAKWLAGIGLPLALAIVGAWMAMVYLGAADRDEAVTFIREWARYDRRTYGGPSLAAAGFIARNLFLFAWPVWPVAVWAWLSWRGMRRAAHVALPLSMLTTLLLLLVLQRSPGDVQFILLLPPMAVLAAFALPTLARGVINAIDWFALLFFTIFCGFLWFMWIARTTGFPPKIANNVYRLIPGFQHSFTWSAVVIALAVTLAWVLVVRWRLSRAPKQIWRPVVISAAGTTLMWVMAMTLWLPAINYAKTYRDVAQAASMALPSTYTCVQPIRMGNAQLASFSYYGHIRFGGPDDGCDVLLRHDAVDYGPPGNISHFEWRLVWEGRRPADRDERFRLYRLVDVGRAAPPRPTVPRRLPRQP